MNLAAAVFGGRIRGGSSAVLNPFVKVTDGAGREVFRLVVFSGKLGGLDAQKKPPAAVQARIASLPPDFRVFFGCDSFIDQGANPSAGRSEEFEVCPVPRRE